MFALKWDNSLINLQGRPRPRLRILSHDDDRLTRGAFAQMSLPKTAIAKLCKFIFLRLIHRPFVVFSQKIDKKEKRGKKTVSKKSSILES